MQLTLDDHGYETGPLSHLFPALPKHCGRENTLHADRGSGNICHAGMI
jgi:hypothetical protein